MKTKWLNEAEQDVARLHAFIARVSPLAADKALLEIFDEVDRISGAPEIGRMWPEDPNYREWLFRFGASGYVIRYRIFENTLYISRIWHGREDRPAPR